MVRRLSRFLDATLRPSITTPPTCGWPEAGSPCATAPVRTGPPWTVKFPEDSSGAVLRRREVIFDGPPDPVPAEAADLVRAYVRSRPLERAACLRTDRTPIEIRGRDGQRLAEVTDDRVTVHVGPGQRLRDAGTSVPAACVTAGELIAAERLERSNLRSKWPRVWKRASASTLRRWF